MSEPQKQGGNPSLFSSTVKGEKAGNFEEMFSPPAEIEEAGVAVAEETPAEEVQATQAAPEVAEPAVPEESDADKLVREVTEKFTEQASEVVAPAVDPGAVAMQGQIDLLKDKIVQMGRAQEDVTEPEEGFDFSALEDESVVALYADAMDDPKKLARMQGVIAQKVFEASQGKDNDVTALKAELDGLKQAAHQQQTAQHNQQVFAAGLQAAAGMGDTEYALVKQFVDNGELDHLKSHAIQHQGDMRGYVPKSALGVWFMGQDPSTGQSNADFARSPSMLQAGIHLFAQGLTGTPTVAESASTTGAGVRAGSSSVGDQTVTNEEGSEDPVLAGILAANAKRKGKAKAFQ